MTDVTNPRAFPSAAIDDAYGGMTLRDWFAGQALAGWLASAPSGQVHPASRWAESDDNAEAIANLSYAMADHMLDARDA